MNEEDKEEFNQLANAEIDRACFTFNDARARIRELAVEMEMTDVTRAVKIAQVGIMEGRYKNNV